MVSVNLVSGVEGRINPPNNVSFKGIPKMTVEEGNSLLRIVGGKKFSKDKPYHFVSKNGTIHDRFQMQDMDGNNWLVEIITKAKNSNRIDNPIKESFYVIKDPETKKIFQKGRILDANHRANLLNTFA